MNDTGRTRKALLASMALAIAAVLTISHGMAAVANANGPIDDKRDAELKDFDIQRMGFDEEGNPYLEVYGKAGQTLPSGDIVYAYVLVTDTGIFASDSHEAQHADDEDVANLAWHGHKVTIDPGAGPTEGDCLTEIGSEASHAMLDRKRVTLEDTEATEIFAAQTVKLHLLVEHPDEHIGECIAEVVEVFDSADPGLEHKDKKLKTGHDY